MKDDSQNKRNESPHNQNRDPEREKLVRELESEREKETPDIWKVLELEGKLGLTKSKIEVLPFREFNLSSGEHYFIMEDAKRRIIKCVSCPIPHGGVLEAHLLMRYKLEDGVLFLDEKPINKQAKVAGLDTPSQR